MTRWQRPVCAAGVCIGWMTLGCSSPGGAMRQGAGPSAIEAISQLGRPLRGPPPGADLSKLEAGLAAARAAMAETPDDPARLVWVGRRLGYLWRYREAIEVFTRGIDRWPDDAALYRHRGHRYLTLRRFDEAIADLEHAARRMAGRADEVEPDGMPNSRGIPLTTLGFNVHYHLGVGWYLKGDFEAARAAFAEAGRHGRGYDDNLVAVTDWMYMCLRRLGRAAEAEELLRPIRPEMEIIENRSYHRRLLMYKGLVRPESLLDEAEPLDWATQGYGLGNWHLYHGRRAEAEAVFRRVVEGPHWAAFGYLAAEAELARMGR